MKRVLGQFWLFILSPREEPLFLLFSFLFLPPSAEAFTRKSWSSSHCCINGCWRKKKPQSYLVYILLEAFFKKKNKTKKHNLSVKCGVQPNTLLPPTHQENVRTWLFGFKTHYVGKDKYEFKRKKNPSLSYWKESRWWRCCGMVCGSREPFRKSFPCLCLHHFCVVNVWILNCISP